MVKYLFLQSIKIVKDVVSLWMIKSVYSRVDEDVILFILKFVYSGKATKFKLEWEFRSIKSKVFFAFSEYLNFKRDLRSLCQKKIYVACYFCGLLRITSVSKKLGQHSDSGWECRIPTFKKSLSYYFIQFTDDFPLNSEKIKGFWSFGL